MEALGIIRDIVNYEKNQPFFFTLLPKRVPITPDTMGIPSLHLDKIGQVPHIWYKLGEGEEITNECEPRDDKIYQAISEPVMYSGISK